MDCLSTHGVLIDVHNRGIEINSPPHGISALYLPTQNQMTPYAHTIVLHQLEEIPVVCEYPDVFPDDLSGMPPDREIEFVIKL